MYDSSASFDNWEMPKFFKMEQKTGGPIIEIGDVKMKRGVTQDYLYAVLKTTYQLEL